MPYCFSKRKTRDNNELAKEIVGQNCTVLVKNVQGNRYIVKTKYTANTLLSLKRSNNCLTTHKLLF